MKDEEILKKVFGTKIVNEEDFDKLYDLIKDDEATLAVFAMRKDLPEKFYYLLSLQSDFVKEILAGNTNTPLDVLQDLAKDDEEEVRKAVLNNSTYMKSA